MSFQLRYKVLIKLLKLYIYISYMILLGYLIFFVSYMIIYYYKNNNKITFTFMWDIFLKNGYIFLKFSMTLHQQYSTYFSCFITDISWVTCLHSARINSVHQTWKKVSPFLKYSSNVFFCKRVPEGNPSHLSEWVQSLYLVKHHG